MKRLLPLLLACAVGCGSPGFAFRRIGPPSPVAGPVFDTVVEVTMCSRFGCNGRCTSGKCGMVVECTGITPAARPVLK